MADAAANAAMNGIDNAEWICGKAEDVLSDMLLRTTGEQWAAASATELAANSPAATPVLEAATARNDQSCSLPGLHTDVSTAPINRVGISQDGSESRAEEGLEPDNCQRKIDDEPSLVAVVDPPRAGLHPRVIHALLHCSMLRRVVYVSCNPDTMVQNAAALCMPPPCTSPLSAPRRGAIAGEWSDGEDSAPASSNEHLGNKQLYVPFSPMKAMAVDLFPHTAHCEAVLLLGR